MKIDTRHFGEVEIDDEKIVKFGKGIFGFDDIHEFAVLYEGEQGAPFAWLQAVNDKNVCLPMVNPMMWYPSYSPDVDDELIGEIGELDQNLLEVFSVVVIPEDITQMTTNLKAPILINHDSKKGIQVIVNDDYDVRHNLYDQIQLLKKAGE